MPDARLSLLALIIAVFAIAASAGADQWVLVADKSDIRFASVKAESVAEVHTFTDVSGSVSEAGMVQIEIPVRSLETGIDIRNSRMLEHLFKAADFPTATLTAQVDLEEFQGLEVGSSASVSLSPDLTIAGTHFPVDADMIVVRTANDTVTLHTVGPVMLDADFFDLMPGIERLKQLAGLDHISQIVPVTATLTFQRAQP